LVEQEGVVMIGLMTKVPGGWMDDETGKVHLTPHLPDGTSMVIFKLYPARLLKAYRAEELKKGDLVHVVTNPNGSLYLDNGGEIFETDGKPGVNFDFV
jgi:hypothetical protein